MSKRVTGDCRDSPGKEEDNGSVSIMAKADPGLDAMILGPYPHTKFLIDICIMGRP